MRRLHGIGRGLRHRLRFGANQGHVAHDELFVGISHRAGGKRAERRAGRLRLRRGLIPELPDGQVLIEALLLQLLCGALTGGERVEDRIIHCVKHGLVADEFYHGLCGVDVHVHPVARQLDMQHAAGELPLEQAVAVRLLKRGGEQLALDEAAVHEEQLPPARAAAAEGLCHEAGDGDIAAAPLDRCEPEGEVPPHRGVDRRLELPVAGSVQQLRAVADELE